MRAFIAKNNLISPGKKIGAAVSGGADSMAMLHLLRALGYSVCVLHFEHGIRPEEESVGDLHFVAQYCAQNDIPFFFERCSVLENTLPGESIEAAARRLRYDFFSRMAEAHHLDLIATAHHADDSVETFFLNLLRGGGVTGLTGISPKRDRIIRPLLFVKRAEIEEYCRQNGIPHVTDATNLSSEYTRNYLRNEIFPKLRQINPEFSEAILRTQEILREEDVVIAADAEREIAKIAVFLENCVEIEIEPFNALPVALRYRVLRRCIEQICPLTDLEKKHFDAVLQLCRSPRTGAQFRLPGKFFAIISYNRLILTEKMYKIDKMGVFPLNLSGDTPLTQGARIHCTEVTSVHFGKNTDLVQYLDADALESAVIRARQEGDLFQPLGMHGRKKLKDWFIDRKIPAERRDAIPLVARGNEILWIIGGGISEKVRVSKETQRIIKCEYQNKEQSWRNKNGKHG